MDMEVIQVVVLVDALDEVVAAEEDIGAQVKEVLVAVVVLLLGF
jgi:hypothetical protein